jgi:pilus assembly protein CpaB
MNSNETRTLWISVGAALFSVFLLYSHSQERESELQKKYGVEESVVVAKQTIQQMQTIVDTDLEIVKKPKDYVEPGAIANPELVIGQVAGMSISKGEQIIESKLLSPGADTGISLQVSPGKRALAIPIEDIRAAGKLIRPGDRVDLIAALDIGKGTNQRREIKTMMQDVVVLATGSRIFNSVPRMLDDDKKNIISYVGDLKYSTITIEATPKEAQDIILLLSTSPSSIFLTVRNPNDRGVSQLPSTSMDNMLGGGGFDGGFRNPSSVAPQFVPPAPVAPQVPTTLPKKKKQGSFIDL